MMLPTAKTRPSTSGEGDDEEDEDEEDNMEDMPPAAVKLEAVLLDNYDKDVAAAAGMAASLVDEEAT
jgi:hypothetical protein